MSVQVAEQTATVETLTQVYTTEAKHSGGQLSSSGGSSGNGHSSSGSLGLNPALPCLALSGAPDTSSGPALALALICGRRCSTKCGCEGSSASRSRETTRRGSKGEGPKCRWVYRVPG